MDTVAGETVIWDGYVSSARGRVNEADVLVETCLGHSRLMPDSPFAQRPGGAPAGRPNAATVRQSAQRLTQLFPTPEEGTVGIQRIIGLLNLEASPKRNDNPEALDNIKTAMSEAHALGEPDVLYWTTGTAARYAWSLGQHQPASEFTRQAIDLYEGGLPASPAWPLAKAAGHPKWFPETWVTRASIAVETAELEYLCAERMGDFDARTVAVDRVLRYAETVRLERPRLWARAVQRQATLHRVLGNRVGIRQGLGQLSELARSDGPDRPAERSLLAAFAHTATDMGDWTRALELNRDRMESSLAAVRDQSDKAIRLESVEQVLAHLLAMGDRSYSAGIGNSCLEQAKALFMLGQTNENTETRDEALNLLDLAVMAYGDNGNNGVPGSRLTRIRILFHAGMITPQEATHELLTISRVGLRGGLLRNAVLEASRVCEPGDMEVKDRIMEALGGPDSTHLPRYRHALTIWLEKEAKAKEKAGEPSDWDQVFYVASQTGEELLIDGRMVSPLLNMEAWLIAWGAHERVFPSLPKERMGLALETVHALATQLVTVSDPGERSRLAEKYSHVFPSAAALAVELGDTAAAELVMEAARRERVGLLLAELTNNPSVGEAVREAAEGIRVANTATPEEGQFRDGTRALAWRSYSSKAIQESRARAVKAATSVIGPAAAMADLSKKPVPLAADLVQSQTTSTRQAAVLQLYRPANQPRSLFWALNLPDGTAECGRSDLSAVSLPNITGSGFWTRLEDLAELLLPESLRRFLINREGQPPLLLTIVPTGLLGIPFDQLPIQKDELFLLDRADVVLTGSLAMTNALYSLPLATPGGWLSVYDHQRLDHAEAESLALAANHDPVQVITGCEELFGALKLADHPHALLALGLHGSGDETGWGQTKLFPDGSTVTAAEALRWEAPRTSVLSSCHSKLETADGTELSGFPAALLLRGSTTVIGSLTEIDDHATSEIMSGFWELTGAGHGPVHALAQAKRNWLNSHPVGFGEPWLWAPLIAYGTH